MSNAKDKTISPFDSFEDLFQQMETRPDYWAERAKLEFTRDVREQMQRQAFSKTDLASRLDVSPALVTRLLSGKNNFELETMVRMARAVNCRFRSHLEPDGAETVWFDVFENQPTQKLVAWDPSEFSQVQRFKIKATPNEDTAEVHYEASAIAA
jgi:transcriptional regulator with XRE-family HTH domain